MYVNPSIRFFDTGPDALHQEVHRHMALEPTISHEHAREQVPHIGYGFWPLTDAILETLPIKASCLNSRVAAQ
jgi:hypothetical protein